MDQCKSCGQVPTQLKTLKLFQAVKVGTKELAFVKSEEYIITLTGSFITITSKADGSSAVSPITNTPYWTVLDPQKEEISEQATSPESSIGAGKTETKKAPVVRSKVPKAERVHKL